MDRMKLQVFVVTVVSEVLLAGSLLMTLGVPSLRIWPPPGRRSWQYRFTWTLTGISFLGVLLVGVLDWNSFWFSHWSRFLIGATMIIFGTGFALWGVRTLSARASPGLGGELVTGGPYRHSRNPQYVGDIALLIGYAVLANSRLGWVTALLGSLWFLLAPYAEEPWLEERHGQAYAEYVGRVPRFLGWRRPKASSQ